MSTMRTTHTWQARIHFQMFWHSHCNAFPTSHHHIHQYDPEFLAMSLHHGLHRPFAQSLRDALLIPDASDKAAVSHVLDTLYTTYDLMVLTNAEWVWAHVKRFIPEPEILLPRVTQVLQTCLVGQCFAWHERVLDFMSRELGIFIDYYLQLTQISMLIITAFITRLRAK